MIASTMCPCVQMLAALRLQARFRAPVVVKSHSQLQERDLKHSSNPAAFIHMGARCSVGKQPSVHTTCSAKFALKGKPMLVLPAWGAFVCLFPK